MKRLGIIIALALVVVVFLSMTNIAKAHGEHEVSACIKSFDVEYQVDKSRKQRYFIIESNTYYYNVIPSTEKRIKTIHTQIPCVTHVMPSYLTEDTEDYVAVPPVNYNPYYNYPAHIIPKWSGIKIDGHIIKVNGTYTFDKYGKFKYVQGDGYVEYIQIPIFHEDAEIEPVMKSMMVYKNGLVKFSGPLIIDTEKNILTFAGHNVGIIAHDYIIWNYEIWRH